MSSSRTGSATRSEPLTPFMRPKNPVFDTEHESPLTQNRRYQPSLQQSSGAATPSTRTPNEMPPSAPTAPPAARIELPDAGNLFLDAAEVLRLDAQPRQLARTGLAAPTEKLRAHVPEACVVGRALLGMGHPAPRIPAQPDSQQRVKLARGMLRVLRGAVCEYAEGVVANGKGGGRAVQYRLVPACRALSRFLQGEMQQLLPLGNAVLVIERYIATRECTPFGAVCGAFAGELRKLMVKWAEHVCAIEAQLLHSDAPMSVVCMQATLQLPLLHLSACICAEASARKLSGAALLDHLHEHARRAEGNTQLHRLTQTFLHAATVPYFRILSQFICTGALDDECEDFMVQEDAAAGGADARAWERQFRLRTREPSGEADVPVILRSVADAALQAGKNWRVLQDCERLGAAPAAARTCSHADDAVDFDPAGRYLTAVETHCRRACAELLDAMRARFGLDAWLETMRQFFLLDCADFLTIFFRAARADLLDAKARVSEMAVCTAFEAAVRMSCLAANPHASRVALSLDAPGFQALHDAVFKGGAEVARTQPSTTEAGEQNTLEFVSLDINVPWPLSIVISPWAQLAYRFCFKHLVLCKNVEAMLGDQWASLRQARRVRGPPRGGLGRALLLLNRMRFFIKRYLAFVFVEVVRPQWHAMCERVASASSLDQVVEAHRRCLARILRFGQLEHLQTLHRIAAISHCCTHFCNDVEDALAPHARATARAAARASASGSAADRRAAAAQRRFESADALVAAFETQGFLGDLEGNERTFTKAFRELQSSLAKQRQQLLTRRAASSESGADAQEEAEMVQHFLTCIADRGRTAGQDALEAGRSDLARRA